MALLLRGKTKCALCGEAILQGQAVVATQHFIHDQGNPLWRYSDATMHYGCFGGWQHRAQFVEQYNNSLGKVVWGNGTRHQMQADGTVINVQAQQEPGADGPAPDRPAA